MLDHELVQKIFRHIDLTQNESRVYLALLESGENSPSGLARYSGLSRRKIYGILEQLLEKGGCLLLNETRKAYVPVSPKILFAKVELEVDSQKRATQQLSMQAEHIYNKNIIENSRISDNVTTLVDPVQILERTVDLVSTTKREILSFSTSSLVASRLKRVDENRYAELNKIAGEEIEKAIGEKGIKFYNITSTESLNTDLIRARMALPQELTNFKVRIVDHIPSSIKIYDREQILFSLRDARTNRYIFKSLHICDKGMAELLAVSFYSMFDKATKLEDLDIEELLKSKRVVLR